MHPDMYSFKLSMSKTEIVRNAQKRIENKLRLAFRVIWYGVVPIPQDAEGDCEPKIFCCLYHCGKWVFCCDYDDFEDIFSFSEEVEWMKKAGLNTNPCYIPLDSI